MRIFYLILNIFWISFYFLDYLGFRLALGKIDKLQRKILFEILKKNKNCFFAKVYNFSCIKNISDFKSNIPILTYQDYSPYTKPILEAKQGILTSEKVHFCMPSSGSTHDSKYIPYTKSLLRQFQKGLYPWIFDLFIHRKRLLLGKCYWSISPIGRNDKGIKSKVKVGFSDDSQYFGAMGRLAIRLLMVVPYQVSQIQDIEAFRYISLLFLLREKNLTFISVWNPSFLTLLLDSFQKYSKSLLKDIKEGKISSPGNLPLDLRKRLTKKLRRDEKRAREIENILKNSEMFKPGSIYRKIWPNLTVISCWSDGSASFYVKNLRDYFPEVEIQGKGLLATEGFISFPLIGQRGKVLSIKSHFFEFIEIDNLNKVNQEGVDIKLAHELEIGKRYSIIITTAGGFYRYRLQDIIEVEGFKKKCPLIRFVGKESKISDLFGEKLNEYHISSILNELFIKHCLRPYFFMVAPEREEKFNSYFYTLFIQLEAKAIPKQTYYRDFIKFIDEFEERLQANYHYQYCRKLGQLSRARIFLINGDDAVEIYHEVCRSLGQRGGDIKPSVLHVKMGWSEKFPGFFLNRTNNFVHNEIYDTILKGKMKPQSAKNCSGLSG